MDYILDGHRDGDEYKFEHLKRDLEMGRELTFIYKDKKYYISHSKEGWHLSKHGGQIKTFSSHEILINRGRIGGAALQDIWNEVEVTSIF